MREWRFSAFGAPAAAPRLQGGRPPFPSFSEVRTSRAPGLLPERKLGDYANWSKTTAPLKRPKERGGGADIFIGGGLDDRKIPLLAPGRLIDKGVMRDYADRYRDETGRPTEYFGNAKTDKVLRAVREANATGGPVNVIGHSWGGTDAYNIAAQARREGLRIDNVVTLDPVGGGLGLAGRDLGKLSPGQWTNITANPRTVGLADLVAAIGGKPSELPISEAGHYGSVRAGHEDVDAMMQAGGRAVLDTSRRLPEIDDNMPMPGWMAGRNAQVARGRR